MSDHRRKYSERDSRSASQTPTEGPGRGQSSKRHAQEDMARAGPYPPGDSFGTGYVQAAPNMLQPPNVANFKFRLFAQNMQEMDAAGLQYFGHEGTNIDSLREDRPPRESAKLFFPNNVRVDREDGAVASGRRKKLPLKNVPFLPDKLSGAWSLKNLHRNGWLLHDLKQHNVTFADLVDRAPLELNRGENEDQFRRNWNQRLHVACQEWCILHGGLGRDITKTVLGNNGRAIMCGLLNEGYLIRAPLNPEQMIFNVHWEVDLSLGLMYPRKAPHHRLPLPPPGRKPDPILIYCKPLMQYRSDIQHLGPGFLANHPNIGDPAQNTLPPSADPLGLILDHEKGNIQQYEGQARLTRQAQNELVLAGAIVIPSGDDEDDRFEILGQSDSGIPDRTRRTANRRAPDDEPFARHTNDTDTSDLYRDQYGNFPSSYGTVGQQPPMQYGQPSSFASGSAQQPGTNITTQQQMYPGHAARSQNPSYGAAPPMLGTPQSRERPTKRSQAGSSSQSTEQGRRRGGGYQ